MAFFVCYAARGKSNTKLHNAAAGTEAGTIKLVRADSFDGNEKNASVKRTIMTGARDMSKEDTVDVGLVDFLKFLEAEIKHAVK